METARVFWSGRSQAVRLPKEYRFKGNEVRIRQHGAAIILEPIPADWAWLDVLASPIDADFQLCGQSICSAWFLSGNGFPECHWEPLPRKLSPKSSVFCWGSCSCRSL